MLDDVPDFGHFNKVYDAVDLPFPEQPKTKVIAEELLQLQELEQLSKKEQTRILAASDAEN